jgi:hypothetical protein
MDFPGISQRFPCLMTPEGSFKSLQQYPKPVSPMLGKCCCGCV